MTTAITYTQLDGQTRLQMVRARIRDLETAQFQLNLRVNTPTPQDTISELDRQNLTTLNESLDKLREMEKTLEPK